MSNNQGVWCSKCYGDHYTNDCPEPVAPVEAKENVCNRLWTPTDKYCTKEWSHIGSCRFDGELQPAEPKPTPSTEPTWVPVYVERAICDLIPDKGYAREIARVAWAWDDEHVGYENSLYRWQNEAIRQRRDLIALQEQIEHERGESQPDSSSISTEPVILHQEKRLTQVFACGKAFEDETPKPLVEQEILNDICKNASSSQRLYFELATELDAWRKWAKGQSNGR